jgi:dCMP deaminase
MSTPIDFKQLRYHRAYLRMAASWSELSHCERKKVGALIVKDEMIISDGYNGTPGGFENCCEDHEGNTHWYVLHAKQMPYLKLPNRPITVKVPPCI